ncbi:ANTAR domain-containing protein [Streptomyces bungoensis]
MRGRKAAPPAGAAVPAARDAARDALDERNRRLAHAGVARAEKLLMSRYRLSSEREAFDLLRRSSQKYNIKLHTLAEVAIHLRGPAAGSPVWVPSRPQGPAPAIPALHGSAPRPGSHSAVLTSALGQALSVTGAQMGNVQLVENGMLRMEKHVGLNRRFTDYFAFVDASTTSCAQAAEEVRQVTVKDVAASDTFDEVSREAILETGSRACHSTLLLSPNGMVIGMISSHHERPLHDLTAGQLTAMHDLGRQVGRWLVWHRNTVVLTALNHLHADATGKPRSA